MGQLWSSVIAKMKVMLIFIKGGNSMISLLKKQVSGLKEWLENCRGQIDPVNPESRPELYSPAIQAALDTLGLSVCSLKNGLTSANGHKIMRSFRLLLMTIRHFLRMILIMCIDSIPNQTKH